METDSDQNQGCDMESSSSQPATPGGSCQGHSKSDCTAAMDEELSTSQVREKIRNLPQSPGFQFACRPMYSEQDTEVRNRLDEVRIKLSKKEKVANKENPKNKHIAK